MNGRVWIAAMALVWVSGCDSQSEGEAMQATAPGGGGAASSLTRYCCDRSLTNCDPEPDKDCAADEQRPVIVWE